MLKRDSTKISCVALIKRAVEVMALRQEDVLMTQGPVGAYNTL